MGYVVNTLLPCLKHPSSGISVSYDELKLSLWYTPTKQAYIQRTNTFDGTFLLSSASDIYTALLLKDVFDIPTVQIADTFETCHAGIDALTSSELNKPVLFISRSEKSLMLDFWEKTRNSFAHGTFNSTDKINYMLGQAKASPSSKANFLLQTSRELCESIKTVWDNAQKTVNGQLESFKYDCLQTALDLETKNGRFYSRRNKRYIVINDDFSFKAPGQRVTEIQELLQKYEGEEQIDVIISENPGNIAEVNMVSHSGNVRAIHQSKLIEYYGLTQIQFITKSEEEKA